MKKSENGLSNVSLVLHDIRSVLNVGAIFRTAEVFGVEEIILSGYTPGPVDRFGRKRNDFAKAALGAEDLMSWERAEDVTEVLNKIKTENRKLVVLEQVEKSMDIRNMSVAFEKNTPLSLVVGNETEGVRAEFITAADLIIEIPVFGKKESLNVSSATAIALYAFLLQN